MVRRVRKKRKYLGGRSHGGGNAKNRRGKGSKGGVGNAGKRKHKWFHTIKFELDAIKKKNKGFYKRKHVLPVLKLSEVSVSEGEFNATGFKVIGRFELKKPIVVKASGFSENARKSIESAGGKAVVV